MHVLKVLDQNYGASRQLAERPHHFGVSGMANEDHAMTAAMVQLRLAVDLGDKRTGRVNREHPAACRLRRHRFRHAVGREDHGRVGFRDLVEFLDEDRPLLLETLDNVFVVDDLVPHIDRRPVDRKRLFDRIDCPDHARAKAARRAKQDMQRRFRHRSTPVVRVRFCGKPPGGSSIGLVA